MHTQELARGAWIHRWRAALRWRRGAEAQLARSGLTLVRWLVLDGVGTLLRESNGPVSQRQVARRLGMSDGVISRVMDRLVAEGLVDRGPSAGAEYRIYLNAEGERALARGRAILDTVSASLNAALGEGELADYR